MLFSWFSRLEGIHIPPHPSPAASLISGFQSHARASSKLPNERWRHRNPGCAGCVAVPDQTDDHRPAKQHAIVARRQPRDCVGHCSMVCRKQAPASRPSTEDSSETCYLQECGAGARGEADGVAISGVHSSGWSCCSIHTHIARSASADRRTSQYPSSSQCFTSGYGRRNSLMAPTASPYPL
jgi:hypothetical protein